MTQIEFKNKTQAFILRKDLNGVCNFKVNVKQMDNCTFLQLLRFRSGSFVFVFKTIFRTIQ